jgi:hypothetical protein
MAQATGLPSSARYGNADAEGPEIGLADPWWVAAAADRVYVGDGYARRIVKVRLTSKTEFVVEIAGEAAAVWQP